MMSNKIIWQWQKAACCQDKTSTTHELLCYVILNALNFFQINQPFFWVFFFLHFWVKSLTLLECCVLDLVQRNMSEPECPTLITYTILMSCVHELPYRA